MKSKEETGFTEVDASRFVNLVRNYSTYGDKSTLEKMLDMVEKNPQAANIADNFGILPLTMAMLGYEKNYDHAVDALFNQLGCNPNAQNKSGNTALHAIIKEKLSYIDGHYDKVLFNIVDILLEKGADPNIQNNKGETALHTLTRQGANCEGLEKLVESLLEKGADPNIQDNKGNTAAYYALIENDAEMYDTIANYTPTKPNENAIDIQDQPDQEEQNNCQDLTFDPKNIASNQDNMQYLALRLTLDYDTEHLELFNKQGSFDLPKIKDCHGDNLLGTIVSSDGWLRYGAAKEHNIGQNPILETAKFLIEAGCNINGSNNVGMTPLHHIAQITSEFADNKKYLVAYQKSFDIAEYFLRSGADVNAQNNKGLSPVYYVFTSGDEKVKKLLTSDKNFEFDKICRDKTKLLTDTISNASYDSLKTLQEKNILSADIKNFKDSEGNTAIHLMLENAPYWVTSSLPAVLKNQPLEALDLLFKLECDVNIANNEGDTPLHYITKVPSITYSNVSYKENHTIVRQKSCEIAQKLLDNGADVNAQNNEGFSSAYNILLNRNQKVFELFKSHINWNTIGKTNLVAAGLLRFSDLWAVKQFMDHADLKVCDDNQSSSSEIDWLQNAKENHDLFKHPNEDQQYNEETICDSIFNGINHMNDQELNDFDNHLCVANGLINENWIDNSILKI